MKNTLLGIVLSIMLLVISCHKPAVQSEAMGLRILPQTASDTGAAPIILRQKAAVGKDWLPKENWPLDMPQGLHRQFTNIQGSSETTIVSAVDGERHHIVYLRISSPQNVLVTLKDSTGGTIVDQIWVSGNVLIYPNKKIRKDLAYAYMQKSNPGNNWTLSIDNPVYVPWPNVSVYVSFVKEKR